VHMVEGAEALVRKHFVQCCTLLFPLNLIHRCNWHVLQWVVVQMVQNDQGRQGDTPENQYRIYNKSAEEKLNAKRL